MLRIRFPHPSPFERAAEHRQADTGLSHAPPSVIRWPSVVPRRGRMEVLILGSLLGLQRMQRHTTQQRPGLLAALPVLLEQRWSKPQSLVSLVFLCRVERFCADCGLRLTLKKGDMLPIAYANNAFDFCRSWADNRDLFLLNLFGESKGVDPKALLTGCEAFGLAPHLRR